MNAYLISQYWYDSLENRNYEGYDPVGVVLTKEAAEKLVAEAGEVPGSKKWVYDSFEMTEDGRLPGHMTTEMHPKLKMTELTVLA